jgi:AraC family transcriptional activator of pobA
VSAVRSIPAYDLYGDPLREPVPGFLHVERIRTRAAIHAWRIGPHRHGDLFQLFFVADGGCQALIEGREHRLDAPWLLWLPAGTVHSFTFDPDTDGIVVTAAADCLAAAAARDGGIDFAALQESVVSLPAPETGPGPVAIRALCEALAAESASSTVAARPAQAALFDLLLVALARLQAPALQPQRDAHTLLFARFRTLVDARVRDRWSIADYAAALAVTPDRLHATAMRVAARPPVVVVHDRLVIEAQRALVYTGMTVAEIAFDLGFRDPAYFSRFFAKRVGRPPAAFRRDPSTQPLAGRR